VSEAPSDIERFAMLRAVDAAREGSPSPNPPVGAVLLREGAVVGVGHHARAGEAHAEVQALAEAGERARGATLYVTLEPCNHHGRTPPCTEAVLRAGVGRVVYAVADPNPHVAGGGGAWLRARGVTVSEGFGVLQPEAERLLAPWRSFIIRGRPFVTLKIAMSLDGRIATRTGESRWITGAAARADGHALRAACDAILVGSGTVRADDPMLTVREARAPRAPSRVIVDSALTTPRDAALLRTAREVPTWILTTPGRDCRPFEDAGVEVLEVPPTPEGRVDLAAAMRLIASRGVVSTLCEGGGGLHGALRDAGLVDRVVAYVAPMVIGGLDATPAVGDVGAATLADSLRVRWRDVARLGDDLRLEGEV
jgi:diaminohydroxyphosphoribosylaminopyrimidine deaminase/5-amino-6-(5-phosphoribosylamino)uracil reductase